MTASLAERLGYPAEAKLLIVSADDLGLCHAANVGVYDCLHTGMVSGATLMVPAPWARDAAARYRGEDVGVHLTVNAEWERYRWGPITHAPSLLDGDGGFPRTIDDFWDHADLDEVRRECRAQIERAILWGFDVSHLDARMGALLMRPEFFDIYLELALDFGLPARIAGGPGADRLGFPARQLAEDAGVVFVEHVLPASGAGIRHAGIRHAGERHGAEGWIGGLQLGEIPSGVTELRLHPAIDTPELRTIAPDWEARVADYRVVCEDATLARAIEASGATQVTYRALRDLARAG